jgi:hypothetical protein
MCVIRIKSKGKTINLFFSFQKYLYLYLKYIYKWMYLYLYLYLTNIKVFVFVFKYISMYLTPRLLVTTDVTRSCGYHIGHYGITSLYWHQHLINGYETSVWIQLLWWNIKELYIQTHLLPSSTYEGEFGIWT